MALLQDPPCHLPVKSPQPFPPHPSPFDLRNASCRQSAVKQPCFGSGLSVGSGQTEERFPWPLPPWLCCVLPTWWF